MKLTIVSKNLHFIEIARIVFKEATCICGDVENIPRENTVFMSPANSIGFMDGGIDYVYSRNMFPNIEKEVKQKIKDLGFTTNLGRPYLRVGSALLIPYEKSALICAPTMFLPHNVSTTRNAYHSFLATLILFHKHKYETLVVTSLCCGYGKMDEEESVHQMFQAYNDFLNNKYTTIYHKDNNVVLRESIDDTQPRIFDNREIQNW
jgi:O-acetyl-ADP-ribose deacetylase (regulator of RNase III)